MPTLHVRNVPQNVYKRLKQYASVENRSISAQVTLLLSQTLQESESRLAQARILGNIRRRRFIPSRRAPDSAELLRQDRKR